jgi:hypothetical protein
MTKNAEYQRLRKFNWKILVWTNQYKKQVVLVAFVYRIKVSFWKVLVLDIVLSPRQIHTQFSIDQNMMVTLTVSVHTICAVGLTAQCTTFRWTKQFWCTTP